MFPFLNGNKTERVGMWVLNDETEQNENGTIKKNFLFNTLCYKSTYLK